MSSYERVAKYAHILQEKSQNYRYDYKSGQFDKKSSKATENKSFDSTHDFEEIQRRRQNIQKKSGDGKLETSWDINRSETRKVRRARARREGRWKVRAGIGIRIGIRIGKEERERWVIE